MFLACLDLYLFCSEVYNLCSRVELIAKTMNRKHLDTDVVSSTGIKSATAKKNFPNIASVPSNPTEDLVQQHNVRGSRWHTQKFGHSRSLTNSLYLLHTSE